MNEDNDVVAVDTSSCASCGIAEIDDIKLKKCTACDLVKYCSDACQKNHKSEHEDACRNRAAELRDELLFKQPDSTHRGDCPICCLPMPLDITKSAINPCCSKVICKGCIYADFARMGDGVLKHSCAFCREPSLVTEEQNHKQKMKRIEANNPVALRREGNDEYTKGNYSGAFEYWTKAAEVGDADAHYRLAGLYQDGEGVEQDKGKAMYHAEEAAIGGHPSARCFLAGCEYEDGNFYRAVKHLIIAAKQGDDHSMKALMEEFRNGLVSKKDLAAALRAHQAAVDATKSPHRKIADDCL